MFISSTLDAIFPDGRPQPAEGRPAPEPKFSGKGWKGREVDVYGAVTRAILGTLVNKPIELRRGAPEENTSSRKFRIYLGYAPQGERESDAPPKLFGIDRVWGGKTYSYTGWGLPIADDEGVIVAEYQHDGLYFLVDPNLYGVFGGARLFAEVLKLLAAEYPAVLAPETAEHFTCALERSIQRSLSAKAPRRKRAEGAAENELEEPVVTWQKVNDQAREAEQESIRLRVQASHEIGREYDSLCKIQKVTSVTVKDANIEVHTDTLYCTDPSNGAVYEMGRFKILIPFESGAAVRWKNKTRQVNGYADKMMALHVYENGKACLGNTAPWFKKLISERKFADAAKLAIAFVETVNVQDTRTYRYIGRWPRIS